MKCNTLCSQDLEKWCNLHRLGARTWRNEAPSKAFPNCHNQCTGKTIDFIPPIKMVNLGMVYYCFTPHSSKLVGNRVSPLMIGGIAFGNQISPWSLMGNSRGSHQGKL